MDLLLECALALNYAFDHFWMLPLLKWFYERWIPLALHGEITSTNSTMAFNPTPQSLALDQQKKKRLSTHATKQCCIALDALRNKLQDRHAYPQTKKMGILFTMNLTFRCYFHVRCWCFHVSPLFSSACDSWDCWLNYKKSWIMCFIMCWQNLNNNWNNILAKQNAYAFNSTWGNFIYCIITCQRYITWCVLVIILLKLEFRRCPNWKPPIRNVMHGPWKIKGLYLFTCSVRN